MLSLAVLLHKVDQVLQAAVAIVLGHLLSVPVHVQRGEPVHLLLAAQLLGLGQRAVHLGNLDSLLAHELSGQLLPRGRHSLAVSTPRSIELDKGRALLHRVLETVGGQGQDHVLLLLLHLGLLSLLLVLLLARHLLHVRLQVLVGSWSRVLLHLLAVLDPEQSRISLDLEVLASGSVLGAIDLGNGHALVVLQGLRQFIPSGRQSLAVSTPRCIEFDKVLASGHMLAEGSLGELDQALVGLGDISLDAILLGLVV